MAINQTEVALTACSKIVDASNKLLDALDLLEAISEQLTSAGINLENYEAAISADNSPVHNIKHCDPATYKNILIFQAGIVTAMKALYDGTPTQQAWAGLQKARL